MQHYIAAKSIPRRGVGAATIALLAALILAIGAAGTVQAQDTIVEEYYVPLPENPLFASFDTIALGDPEDPVHTIVTIAIGGNTIIYYDQWENGYEADITNPANLYRGPGCGGAPNPGGTQIWGNNDPCDGIPPGFTEDLLTNGDVIVLENDIPMPRNPSQIYFDGGDKFATTYPVAVTRKAYPAEPGPLLAGAVEVYNTRRWGKEYRIPVGDSTSGDTTDAFQYTYAYVMAGNDGTQVFVNNDPPVTIGEGGNLVIEVDEGDTITATNPIQVDLVTGDEGSEWEMRWYSLPPLSDWTHEYYMPVADSATDAGVAVWLFNPNDTQITVYWETPSDDGDIDLDAGEAKRVSIPSSDTEGARFYTDDGKPFFALAQIDIGGGSGGGNSGRDYDWGFPLLPGNQLSPQVLVGFGRGCTEPGVTLPGTSGECPIVPSGAIANNSRDNGARSFVWVMPVSGTNVDVYVSYTGKLPTCPAPVQGTHYDTKVTLNALQIAEIMDPNDLDMTGARIWACGGVNLAVAYGQDPSESVTNSRQAMDLGTVILSLPSIQLEKSATLTVDNDKDGDGAISPGDIITYTIAVVNNGAYPATFTVSDTLPAGMTYVPNSTRYGSIPVPDNALPDTAFPLDEDGLSEVNGSPLTVGGGEVKAIYYQVVINEGPNACAETLVNSANVRAIIDDDNNTVNVDSVDETTVLKCHPGIRVIKKTNGHDANDPPGPNIVVGAPVEWTYEVTNIGDVDLTNVILTDDKLGNIGELAEANCTIPALFKVGATFTCSATGIATLGQYANTAIVTGTSVISSTQIVTDDDKSHYMGAQPAITVTKTANPKVVQGTSGDVQFTVKVENTGNVTVLLTSLVDSVFNDLTQATDSTCVLPQELDLGGNYECTFTGTVVGDEGNPHENEVTATGKDKDENPAEAKDDETVTFDQLPAISVTKTANPQVVQGTSGDVQFTVEVENTGPVTVLLTSLVDSDFGNLVTASNSTCVLPQELDLGGTYSCTFTGTVNGDENTPHENEVTATGKDKDENPVSAKDDETVTFDQLPVITVTKTANPKVVQGTSGDVQFTVKVENTGNVTVLLTSLVDSVFNDLTQATDSTCQLPQELDLGGTYSCTFTGTVNGDENTPHENEVTATGKDKDENPAEAKDDETVTFDQLPAISVTKTATPTVVKGTSDIVTYTVKVKNTGTVTVEITKLHDSRFGDITTTSDKIFFTTCDLGEILEVEEEYSCYFEALVTGSEAQSHTNEVTAEAKDKDENPATAKDDETVTFDELPTITVTKTPTPTKIIGSGGVVTYTVKVDNTGLVTVLLTSLTDSVFGNLTNSQNISSTTCVLPRELAVPDSYSCEFSAFVTGSEAQPHLNEVTAIGEDKDGNPASAKDTATVAFDELPVISVTKTANPEFVTEPGALVTFEVVVQNLSPEPVFLVEISDALEADSTAASGDIANNTCLSNGAVELAPQGQPGDSYTCSFTRSVNGSAGQLHHNRVTARAYDNEENEATDSDDATVTINALPPATLGDFVWRDINGNGIQDPDEPGVPGVTLRLLDSNNQEVATTQTDPTGYYQFTNLKPGDYKLEVIKPDAAVGFSPRDQGDDDTKDSDVDPATGQTPLITLPPGSMNDHTDVGLIFLEDLTTTIGDRVWVDANQNGLQDEGEAGLDNVTVTLFRDNGEQVATTTTKNGGLYLFENLPLGSYYIEVTLPAGHVFAPANVENNGQDERDSDLIAPTVIVTASTDVETAKLGEPLTYTLSYQAAGGQAGNVQLHVTVPAGTTADLANSTPGWTCNATPAVGGTVCTLTVGQLAGGATGNATFVVLLDTNDELVPNDIELSAAVTHATPGRSHTLTPPAGGSDLTVDAGLVQGEQRHQTDLSVVRDPASDPTGLEETTQPTRYRLYLPALP